MADEAPDRAHALADGLWRRLRDVILVAERVDTFAFGPESEGEQRGSLVDEDAAGIALDFVLRALKASGDRGNWTILALAADGDRGASIDELAEATGLPRLAVIERVNELLQGGLVIRALDADRVLAGPAGLEIVALVRAAAERLAARATEARNPEGARGNGLPMV